MSSFSSERLDIEKYEVSHTMAINRIASMISRKKEVTSDQIFCIEDPRRVQLQIKYNFGETNGHLSVQVFTSQLNAIRITGCVFTIFDAQMQKIPSLVRENISTDVKTFSTEGILYPRLCVLSQLKHYGNTTPLKFQCDISYEGDVVKTDSVSPVQFSRDVSLSNDMINLFESADGADVTFHLGSKSIKAHKCILVARSAYFRRMFESGMRETVTNQIHLDEGLDFSVFKEILKFIYCGATPCKINEIAVELLPLADQYEMSILMIICASAIRTSVSVKNVLDVMILADTYDLPDLARICLPIFKRNMKEIRKEDGEAWDKLEKHPKIMWKILTSLAE